MLSGTIALRTTSLAEANQEIRLGRKVFAADSLVVAAIALAFCQPATSTAASAALV